MRSEPSSRSVGGEASQSTADAYRWWQAARARWQADGGWNTGVEPLPLTHYVVSAALKHLGRNRHAPSVIRDGDVKAVEAANDIDVGSHKVIRIDMGSVVGLRLNAYKQWQADRARWQADRDFGVQVGPEPPLTHDIVSAALKHLGRDPHPPSVIRDGDVKAVEAANDIDVGSHTRIRGDAKTVVGLRLNAYKQWQADRARWRADRDFGEQVGPEPPLTRDIVSTALKHLRREPHEPANLTNDDVKAVEAANDIAAGSHKLIRGDARKVAELEKAGLLPASRSGDYGQSGSARRFRADSERTPPAGTGRSHLKCTTI